MLPTGRDKRDFPQASLAARSVLMLIEVYRATLSPLLGGQCRFVPTCSEYCRQAVLKHGALAGSVMGLRRLLRCHPFSRGGYDPLT